MSVAEDGEQWNKLSNIYEARCVKMLFLRKSPHVYAKKAALKVDKFCISIFLRNILLKILTKYHAAPARQDLAGAATGNKKPLCR